MIPKIRFSHLVKHARETIHWSCRLFVLLLFASQTFAGGRFGLDIAF